MTDAVRPGGLYLGADGKTWHDANGNVVKGPTDGEKRAQADAQQQQEQAFNANIEAAGEVTGVTLSVTPVAEPPQPEPTAAADQPPGPLPPAPAETRGESGLVGRGALDDRSKTASKK